MDNHRMAAWCWANHIDNYEIEKYTIIHIDRHNDTVANEMEQWTSSLKNGLKGLSLNEYDNIEYQKNKHNKYKVFKWNNYIPLFHHYYSNQINRYIFFTNTNEKTPDFLNNFVEHCPACNLFNSLRICFGNSKESFIINLDIDFFFIDNPRYKILYSDSVIKKLIKDIMELMKNDKNILTIALSPECCGGWANSLKFMKKYFSKYDIIIE